MTDHPNQPPHEDLGFLEEFVDAVRQDTPEESWCQAARHRLQDSLESPKEESWIMKLIKNSQQGKIRWAVAVPLAALLVIALIFGIPDIGGNSPKAFARVVRQIRTARTLVFTSITRTSGTPAGIKIPEMKMEIAFKEPGLMRSSNGSVISITDFSQRRGVTIDTKTKEFTEIDFKNIPGDAPRVASNEIDWLRNIPEQANEVLEAKKLGGRSVAGYRVTKGGYNMTAWIDLRSGDLVTIEMDLSKIAPGTQAIMSDFKFNVPLDDALFSMAMPSGFRSSRIDLNAVRRDEKPLIDFLRLWASSDKFGKGSFPPSLNAMELVKVIKKIPLDQQPPDKRTASDEQKKRIKESQEILQKGLMFPLYMKPENDWNYAGEGIKFGDNTQPVCWWKPDGSKTYRVVVGDLSVIDLDLSGAPPGGKPSIPAKR